MQYIKQRLILLALAFACAAAYADGPPNPCPGGDCGSGEIANAPFVPTYYAPGSLVVYPSAIHAGGYQLMTNYGPTVTTNGLAYAQNHWLNMFAATNVTWVFTLAVTNSTTNAYYTLEYSGRAEGPYDPLCSFIGRERLTETNIAVVGRSTNNFFRVRRTGQVIWRVVPSGSDFTQSVCGSNVVRNLSYVLHAPQWGYEQNRNYANSYVIDPNRSDTVLAWVTDVLHSGCSTGGRFALALQPLVSSPPREEAYRFTVHWPNSVPAAGSYYPLVLINWDDNGETYP